MLALLRCHAIPALCRKPASCVKLAVWACLRIAPWLVLSLRNAMHALCNGRAQQAGPSNVALPVTPPRPTVCVASWFLGACEVMVDSAGHASLRTSGSTYCHCEQFLCICFSRRAVCKAALLPPEGAIRSNRSTSADQLKPHQSCSENICVSPIKLVVHRFKARGMTPRHQGS